MVAFPCSAGCGFQSMATTSAVSMFLWIRIIHRSSTGAIGHGFGHHGGNNTSIQRCWATSFDAICEGAGPDDGMYA
eukprot:scaffold27129_cov73-Attheya_sp.AAC.3